MRRLLGSIQLVDFEELAANGMQFGLPFPVLLLARAGMSVMDGPQAAKMAAFLSLKVSSGESLQPSQICAYHAQFHTFAFLGIFGCFCVRDPKCLMRAESIR